MVRRGAFASGVDDFALRFLDGAESTMRVTAIKAGDAFVSDTPVKEGRMRGAWQITGHTPSVKIGKKDKSGASTKTRMKEKIIGMKDWSMFTFTNNMPYAVVIEYGLYPDPVKNGTRINKSGTRKNPITPIYKKFSKSGYSKQASSGIVRVNIARMNRLIELEARRRLPK